MRVPTVLNPWAILAVVILVPIAAGVGYLKGHPDAEKDCTIEKFESQQAASDKSVPR